MAYSQSASTSGNSFGLGFFSTPSSARRTALGSSTGKSPTHREMTVVTFQLPPNMCSSIAKNEERSKTGMLPRTAEMNARYKALDGDPRLWKPGDLTAPGASTHKNMVYAVQSPFTGELHYPSPGRCWGSEKSRVKEFLVAWGSKYVERDLADGHPAALVIQGAPLPGEKTFRPDHPVLKRSREEAVRLREAGNWPAAHWRDGGQGTFGMKKYLEDVRQGKVATTYWSDDDYETPLSIEA